MKKILIAAAILATVASCSKDEVTNTPKGNQIDFTTLNDRVTKNANDNATAVDFRVFAEKAGATAWFFTDYVTGGAVNATRPAGGPHFWPTDGSDMTFYAYAPYATTGNTVTETDVTVGNVDLKYVVPAGAQEDFTVATPVVCAGDVDYPESVDLTFNHMLSKVTVLVALEDEFGDKNYISSTTDAEYTATITALKNVVTVDATATDPAPVTADAADATSMVYNGVQSYYIAPQPFANCKLQINGITIRDIATESVVFGAKDGSADEGKGVNMKELTFTGAELGGADAAFEAGKHYVLTVTISAASTDEDGNGIEEILFTAGTTGWGTDVAGGLNQD